MGLDVLSDGGCAVRVPVQRHLILWLCLLSFSVAADSLFFDTKSGAQSACQSRADAEAASHGSNYDYQCVDEGEISPGDTYPYVIRLQSFYYGNEGGVLGRYWYKQDLTCDAPNYLNPETGECLPPKTPEQCSELGKAFDPEINQCADDCPGGMLNGVCLADVAPEDCGPGDDNYRGDVPLGFGGSPVPVCGDLSCTIGGKPGHAGVFNGELKCLADDYGAPKCKGGSITVIDEYGFVCESLDNQPEEPQVAEDPNTDTDGDGTPDDYQRKNDPESIDKGLDNIANKLDKNNEKTDVSNQHLDNIENAVKGMADNVASLEKMGKNGELAGGGGAGSGSTPGLQNENGDDYLGDLADIKQNTKDTADTLNEIKDGPQDGYNTDGLGDAPTFEQSTDRLQAAITQNPTIEAVTSIPSIATNETCPVWTIPATDFWEATPMDVHCDILNQYRGLFSALFTAVWTLAAVFVFLRA